MNPTVLRELDEDLPFSVTLADGLTVTCRLKRSVRRRRTIAIQMAADGTLAVAAPERANMAQVRAFLSAHNRWLQRVIARHQATGLPVAYTEGAILPYLGHPCRLTLREGRAGCTLQPRQFVISLPRLATQPGEREQMTKLELRLWFKRRARQKLTARLTLWAQRLGIHHRDVKISDARRRWGSCSAANDIRLNWRLIMAPLELIDYVCVHELCHVRHKNHGAKFWQAVAHAMPDYAERERELKRHAALLTAF